MVNIGRGVEDVEDSLPRTPLSERGKRMEEKTILIVEDDMPAEAERKRLFKGTMNLKDLAERINYE